MMEDRFPAADFDRWAPSYDRSVQASGFPFEGYLQVLRTVWSQAGAKPGSAVLDLGVGTGNLAQLFMEQGCELWGLDFSAEMLAQAKAKLPQAHLGQADLRGPWPAEFGRRFDCIVSAYVFHHFPLAEKVRLAVGLAGQRLRPGGRLVIGDIAFADRAAEEAVRRSPGTEWEQEEYWRVDEALPALARAGLQAEFFPVSFCAGVMNIHKFENILAPA